MDRRALVASLLNNRGNLMVITGIGSSTYDVAACATSAGIDLAQAAAACRLRVETVSDLSRADELRTLLHSGPGPIFIHARVDADDQKRIIPSRDGLAIKHRFMQAAGTLA